MSAITVNVKQEDKELFGSICEKMGLNVSSAINVYIKAVNRAKKIPFSVSADCEKPAAESSEVAE